MTLKNFVEHKLFNTTILALILVNAVIIGLETYPSIFTEYEMLSNVLNNTLLAIFTVEIILKIVVYKSSFFKNGWNIMDFLIVALSLIFINSRFVSLLRITYDFSISSIAPRCIRAFSFHTCNGQLTVFNDYFVLHIRHYRNDFIRKSVTNVLW